MKLSPLVYLSGRCVRNGSLNGHPPRRSEELETVSQNSGYVHYELNHAPEFFGLISARRVQSYLVEMIEERKDSYGRDERRDLLSNLVSANDEFSDDGEQRLGEGELIGTESGLGLTIQLLKFLPFRKRGHFLHGWTRGEDSLLNTKAS